MYRPLWIEIDLKALRHNYLAIKKSVGLGVGIMATIKQQAYGHGLLPVARQLSRLGVRFFGLGDLAEAIQLREHALREPILLLSALSGRYAEELIRYRIRPTVFDLSFARALDAQARKSNTKIPVHIKIDTGMGRLGIWHEQAREFVQKVSLFKNITLEGIYTHFPSADTDTAFTKEQLRYFNRLLKELSRQKITFTYRHCANSVALARYRQAHFNLVRPGLILYGIKPSSMKMRLAPLLSLKSKIIFLKDVKEGRSISYGRTYITQQPTRIATVAVGYADGYPWNLSNKGKVIINNSLYDIVGRVCMDHIMVDVGARSRPKVNDEVVLLGESKTTKISAEDIADWAQTIPYEVVSRLSARIPRIYKPSAY